MTPEENTAKAKEIADIENSLHQKAVAVYNAGRRAALLILCIYLAYTFYKSAFYSQGEVIDNRVGLFLMGSFFLWLVLARLYRWSLTGLAMFIAYRRQRSPAA